jgi:hypothetical protein
MDSKEKTVEFALAIQKDEVAVRVINVHQRNTSQFQSTVKRTDGRRKSEEKKFSFHAQSLRFVRPWRSSPVSSPHSQNQHHWHRSSLPMAQGSFSRPRFSNHGLDRIKILYSSTATMKRVVIPTTTPHSQAEHSRQSIESKKKAKNNTH